MSQHVTVLILRINIVFNDFRVFALVMTRTDSKKKITKKAAKKRQRHIAVLGGTLAAIAAAMAITMSRPVPVPKHTSILTGQRWLNELLEGHGDRIHEQLGVSKHVFRKLHDELVADFGLRNSKYITAGEQLAIFLYFGRTGLGSRMLQERFQRSGSTISQYALLLLSCSCLIHSHCRYIRKLTKIFAGPFYRKYVKLMPDETPPEIRKNPKLFPYFEGCRGVMDGVQFDGWVHEDDSDRYRSRKGRISQNVLACSDFKLRFIYILTGWEGSAADSRVFEYARKTGLTLPPGQYFLADAGFPLCDLLMTPYCGVRYHLKEWGRGNQK